MNAALPVLVSAGVFVATALALEQREAVVVRRRVAAYVDRRRGPGAPPPASEGRGAAALLPRLLVALEARLQARSSWNRLALLLERAGVSRRPLSVVGLALVATILLGAAAHAAGAPPLLAVALPVAALAAGRVVVAVRIERRRRAFEEQLPELLGGLAAALRAGHGFQQALQSAAADAREPTAEHLSRVLAEMRLGGPPEDALAALGRRVGSSDFDFVLEAVLIQRQVGGSLAGIFEIVAESVRQRQQFALRIRALTATGRLSVLVLVALPVAMAVLLTAVDHTYLSPLLDTHTGRLMLVASAAFLAVGSLWLRRIASFKG